MRFSPQRFNRHLENMGQQLLWRAAYACSCVNHATGAPDPKCQLCSKRGRIWDPAKKTVCGIASQKTQASWAKMGMWETGDIVVTIPENSPMWDSGQYDRVTMLNATDRFSLPLTRGAPNETLALFSVKSIERVFWKHPQTQVLVEGALPTMALNGTLVWPDEGSPPPGHTYSITGWKHSDYFIFGDYPSSRNEHSGTRLPKRVVLRRWDLLGRT